MAAPHGSAASVLPFVLRARGRRIAGTRRRDGAAVGAPGHRDAQAHVARADVLGRGRRGSASAEARKRALTVTPVETGYGPAGPTASFDAYEIHQGRIHVPRFYGFKEWGPAADVTLAWRAAHVRRRALCRRAQRSRPRRPRHHCQSARAARRAPGVPCGYGKTVCALWIAHALKRRRSSCTRPSSSRSGRARQPLPPWRLGGANPAKRGGGRRGYSSGWCTRSPSASTPRNAPRVVFVIIDEAHHVAPFSAAPCASPASARATSSASRRRPSARTA